VSVPPSSVRSKGASDSSIFPLPGLTAIRSASSNRARQQAVCRMNSLLRVSNICVRSLNYLSGTNTGFSLQSGLFSSAPQHRVLDGVKRFVSSFLLSCRQTSRDSLPPTLLYDELSDDTLVSKLFDACGVYMNTFNVTKHYSALPFSPSSSLSFSPNSFSRSSPPAQQNSASTSGVFFHPSISSSNVNYDYRVHGYGPAVLDAALDDHFRPLVASRLALPSEPLPAVSLSTVLQKELAENYVDPARAPVQLLRDPAAASLLLRHLPKPKVSGSRSEYVSALGRLFHLSMVEGTDSPKCVNGLFAIKKDSETDRLICDARWANAYFQDSPVVVLPDPSLFASLVVPKGYRLLKWKIDLSNFYHHLSLPVHLRPFFCLPPISRDEAAAASIPWVGHSGVDSLMWPQLTTIPMGWSHAVYIAQSVNESVVYRSGLLSRSRNLLSGAVPTPGSPAHTFYVDDGLSLHLVPDGDLAAVEIARELHAALKVVYRAAGLPVNVKKDVEPTFAPTSMLGMVVDTNMVTPPLPKLIPLLARTLELISVGASSKDLERLVGGWTWVCLLRRPSLSAFGSVYEFMRRGFKRRTPLWPSVARELLCVAGLAPLLQMDLATPVAPTVIATDASLHGAGVVSARAPLSQSHVDAWFHASRARASFVPDLSPICPHPQPPPLSTLPPAMLYPPHSPARVLHIVRSVKWSQRLAVPWRFQESINALELRALLLGVRWYSRALQPGPVRLPLLVDSTTAFFAVRKGRSSGASIRFITSQLSAYLLALNIFPLPQWVASALNPADGPSRVHGDARPETQASRQATTTTTPPSTIRSRYVPGRYGPSTRLRRGLHSQNVQAGRAEISHLGVPSRRSLASYPRSPRLGQTSQGLRSTPVSTRPAPLSFQECHFRGRTPLWDARRPSFVEGSPQGLEQARYPREVSPYARAARASPRFDGRAHGLSLSGSGGFGCFRRLPPVLRGCSPPRLRRQFHPHGPGGSPHSLLQDGCQPNRPGSPPPSLVGSPLSRVDTDVPSWSRRAHIRLPY